MNRRHLAFSVFAAALLAVAAGCGKTRAAPREAFDIPPSLVHLMTMAHTAARNRMAGGPENLDGEEFIALVQAGFTNAVEIAERPRGKMVFADDGLDEEERRELWPFDFESFEATLEAQTTLDEHGLFCLKDENGEPAFPQLDARFGRLDDETFRALTGGDESSGDMRAWPIDRGAGEYFVIARTDGAWAIRNYIYLRWDGETPPVSFAEFESFPGRREAAAMRTVTDNPASLNNMAVLVWEHRSERIGMDPRGLKGMLETASGQGVECARDNLAVLLEHIPEAAE